MFIYNLRQPSTAKKKPKEKKKKKDDKELKEKTSERTSEIVSGLRRALFESQTYELSADSKMNSGDLPPNSHPAPTTKRKSSPISKLPTVVAGEKSKPRTLEEEEEEQDDTSSVREGLLKKEGDGSAATSKGGRQRYGSLDKHASPPRTSTEGGEAS